MAFDDCINEWVEEGLSFSSKLIKLYRHTLEIRESKSKEPYPCISTHDLLNDFKVILFNKKGELRYYNFKIDRWGKRFSPTIDDFYGDAMYFDSIRNAIGIKRYWDSNLN